MNRWMNEIRYDVSFIKNHKLQPAWYKYTKIFILLALLAGYALLFGWKKCLLFLAVFFLCCAIIHFMYRFYTRKFTQSWLDFRVYEEDGQIKTGRIGKVYYSAILISALLACLISQLAVT
jgi:hypothetical protein